ncbi:MAG: hypothetical protein AB8G11_08605 [Saprospiraceae bacterium]
MPEFTREMLFFSAVSGFGLLLLSIGWIISVFDGEFEFFGGEIDLDGVSDIDISELDGGLSDAQIDVSEMVDDVSVDEFDGGLPIPSFFSLKVIRIVLLCFGLGGNTGLRIGWDFINSLILAFITGFLSGYIVYRAFIFVYKQTIYDYRDPKIVGRKGRVTLAIPAEGFGQIVVYIVGQRYIFRAKSFRGKAIEQDVNIIIKNKRKGTCYVEPIETSK